MDSEFILAEADRCVKCGYCLPHCPTYALNADEGESPRGRIALIQGLVTGMVDSRRLHDHLDSCLACRACEAACPSEVHFGRLITAVRTIQRDGSHTPGIMTRSLLHTLSHAPYASSISGLAGIYQSSGLASLTGMLGGKNITRLNKLLPAHMETSPWKGHYPPTGTPLGRIGLFTGCITRITDRAALDASIHILNRLGFEVVVPPDQGCCGAMHQHSGDSAAATSMAKRNHAAFSGLGLDAVVGVATGCLGHLMELPDEVGMPVTTNDITDFLYQAPGIKGLRFRPLHRKVAIHIPCSQKNVLKQAYAPLRLLKLIPEINLMELPDNGLCCGGAGLYVITNPEGSDRLREDKINGLRTSQADILVTSNTGCSLHISAGIRDADMEAEVLHPVVLLARQLSD